MLYLSTDYFPLAGEKRLHASPHPQPDKPQLAWGLENPSGFLVMKLGVNDADATEAYGSDRNSRRRFCVHAGPRTSRGRIG